VETIGAMVLGLVPGLVLGYLAVMPRVMRVEKELFRQVRLNLALVEDSGRESSRIREME